MNHILASLFDRKSVRVFEDRPVPEDVRNLIIDAAIQAPTAGNQVLYTILDIRDQEIKDDLAVFCDYQPFIAKAPMVLIFLADCRRWLDCYHAAGIDCRPPGPGDFVLSCADACIAAQNAVVAAESLGIGSCYIGDVTERCEDIVPLLNLDEYVFPAAMVVFGYPTAQQKARKKPARFDRKYIVRIDRYTPLPENDLRAMFRDVYPEGDFDFDTFIRAFCERKYSSDFAREMGRSVRKYLEGFLGE